MPQAPLIYVSYGIVKSGSTLAFELAKAIHEVNGLAQPRLSKAAIPSNDPINFVKRMDTAQLEAIEREAAALGHPIVLKTHQPPTDDVKAWIAAGRIRGHCAFRDLREVALSMMDHGSRAREHGHRPFSRIASFEDALRGLHRQVPHFLEWVRCPGMLPLFYDDVAFDTPEVVRRLCEQTGLEADPDKVERRAKGGFTQFNKGVRGRFHEMPGEESERVLAEFRDFYAEFIDPRGPPPPPPEVREPRKPNVASRIGRLLGLPGRLNARIALRWYPGRNSNP